jgi:aspartate 1-decarboxylase
MINSKKHKDLIKNYEKIKSKHLEKLASKLLKIDEQNQKLKTKNINPDFLKNF